MVVVTRRRWVSTVAGRRWCSGGASRGELWRGLERQQGGEAAARVGARCTEDATTAAAQDGAAAATRDDAAAAAAQEGAATALEDTAEAAARCG
jgi:hypothetical protein